MRKRNLKTHNLHRERKVSLLCSANNARREMWDNLRSMRNMSLNRFPLICTFDLSNSDLFLEDEINSRFSSLDKTMNRKFPGTHQTAYYFLPRESPILSQRSEQDSMLSSNLAAGNDFRRVGARTLQLSRLSRLHQFRLLCWYKSCEAIACYNRYRNTNHTKVWF